MTAPSMDAVPRVTRVRRDRSPGAAVAVALSGVLAFFMAGALLDLVRETLHFNCSWGIGGEWGVNGTWLCADGIGYVGVAVVLGGMSGVLLLAGLLTAFALPSLSRSTVYLVLAAVSLAWISWWTFYAATTYTGPRPVGETGPALWTASVLPGLSVSTVGLLVGAAGVLAVRRWSPVAIWAGVGMILVSTTLQPGIAVATVVSAGMLAAAAAGAGRRRGR